MDYIRNADPAVWQAIHDERRRQQDGLEMIASENYTSTAVMAAQGSVLTNKYAEGLPGKRYYGGCEFVDVVEKLAIERVCKLFGAERANVQPHSGAQANMAVYFTCMKPGDTLLAMDLAHGGHLTHGMHLNFSGKFYKVVSYGIRKDTERIDMDHVAKSARESKPRIIVAGASSYPREIDFAAFAQIAKEVGALFMVDMAHIAGLVAAKLHNSPVPVADFVTSTTHKTLRGPRGGLILCKQEWASKINSTVFPGIQGGPLMHVIAGKAIVFNEALQPEWRAYAAQIIANAKALAEVLMSRGFRLVSGGTDNHMMVVDVASRGVLGKLAEESLDAAGITVNKQIIPFDSRQALDPSGIRVGSSALTTRGMKETEMKAIAGWIADVLSAPDDKALHGKIRGKVRELGQQFPAPQTDVGA